MVVEQKPVVVQPKDWKRFPLSPRERAGVGILPTKFAL
jgi:hypothetical protein